MGWMATILGFICRLAGYNSCSALSTFEAIILACLTVGIITVVLRVALASASSR